jgi:glycosyltransferase involved in cell wall biosynthesis
MNGSIPDTPRAVSIIIPTFNCAAHVEEAVQSALSQTLPAHQVLVIDDGSTDDTRERLGRLRDAGRIQYFYQPNAGKSTARNLGIKNALSEWLLFLDSDDVLLPTALEDLARIHSQFPAADLVAGRSRWIDEAGRPICGDVPRVHVPGQFTDSFYLLLTRDIVLLPGLYIVNRRALGPECYFDTSLPAREDHDFCLRAALRCKIVLTDCVIQSRRKYKDRCAGREQHLAGLAVARKHLALIKKEASIPPPLKRTIQSNLNLSAADNYFLLDNSSRAMAHYVQAVRLDPAKALDRQVVRQILASLVPGALRKRVRHSRLNSSAPQSADVLHPSQTP